MKKLLLLSFLFLPFVMISQQSGWRPGEMEVGIDHLTDAQRITLHEMKLNGDIYRNGKALLYLVPEELELVRALGISYTIRIPDLNEHYKGFWANREEYHSYDEIIQAMNSLAFGHSSICSKYDYGMSMGGRQLTALKISDNVEVDEAEPEIGFDGGIHGDEIGGPENLIRFAEFLCNSYGSDPDITALIDSREIWLYMMVNPDGRVNMSRYNNNGVDLNRDWGYMWDAWGGSPGGYSQVETKALRNWFYDHQFVVHTTYHSGTEELVYPWSYRPDPSPDDNHIDALAVVYVTTSGYANLEYGQGFSGLYPINGSSKDTYYGVMGSIGWTMEISDDKQPPTSQIIHYYSINESAMIAMIEHAGYGLRGFVTDVETGNPIPAWIVVNDLTMPTYTDPDKGDYFKYVVPGNYSVTAYANGYAPLTKNNIQVSSLSSTLCNFALTPNGDRGVYRFCASQIPENNFEDEGNTPATLGAPDDEYYSMGKNGWVILDMGESILDGPGMEIRVHEGDNSPEGYTCQAGPTMDGPWIFLGNGNGSTSFDFGDAGLAEARFVKLTDDGDGVALEDDAGFDLDAIEILDQPNVVFLNIDCEVDDAEGNNNQRLDPGETASLVFSIRNHGGLTASATTANLNFDSTWVTIEQPDIAFGDIAHGEMVSVAVPIVVDAQTPAEEIFMTVLNVEANGGDYQESLPMHHVIGAIVEDFETGNFSQYDWSFTYIPWNISPVNVHEGVWSAKSANIGDGQKSGLQITLDVIGYDDISFFRFVSSESGYDFLNFFIDGNLIDQWSGDVPWGEVSYDVTPGLHTFRWTFEKDDGTSHGYDAGWIDNIRFPSFNLNNEYKVIANAVPTGYCEPGESQLGAYLVGGEGMSTFAWTPETNINSTTHQFPDVWPEVTTVYSVEATNQGNTASAGIKVAVYGFPEPPVIAQQGDSIVSSYGAGNQWYDSEGLIEGATGAVHYPEQEDTYYCIHTSAFGCPSDTSNLVNFLWTSIEDPARTKGLGLYPNPFNDRLTVRFAEQGSYTVKMSDLSGRVFLVTEAGDVARMTFSTEQLDAGVYLVHVYRGEEFLGAMKVIK